jgi:hypothetical protein
LIFKIKSKNWQTVFEMAFAEVADMQTVSQMASAEVEDM